MLLQINFNLLLASVLAVLSNTGDVQAAPAKGGQMATLPLRSLHHSVRDSDVHPHILLQQHINRSVRRLARMTGREEPSAHELRANLQKRVDGVHVGFAMGQSTHSKRYFVRPAPAEGGELLETPGSDFAATGRFKNRVKGAAKAAKAAKAGVAGAIAGAAGVGAGAGATGTAGTGTAGTAAGAGAGTAAGAAVGTAGAGTAAAGNATTAAAGTGAGVSPIDIAAAAKGGLTQAGTPTANNSLGLNIEANDVGYIAPVQIGTPPTTFQLLMDSGSADLWVGGEACQSQAGGGCGTHTFLGTKSSSTFKDTTTQFQVTYGTGQVAGTLCTDNINLAGLPLATHTFGTASAESTDFSSNQTPFDGLMGLAQSTLSQQKVLTPPESLAKTGTISAAITSFKISRLADQKNDGEITFGGLDSTKFQTNTLVTVKNVNTQGFWEAPMVPTVGGKSVGLDTGRTAILDTGTTLIVAPPSDAAAIHQAIPGAASDGQGGFTVPCTTTASVEMTFGGQTFAIDPRDIAFLPVQANDPTGNCISGISSGTIGGAQEWLVGDVFLKNAYFSTDVGANTLSLAKLT